MANLNSDCNVMLDQVRAVDNVRLKKKIGILPEELIEKVMENIKVAVFEME